MAEENDNSQEKTEEPTPRRLEKAKEEGQTARSKELATIVRDLPIELDGCRCNHKATIAEGPCSSASSC